jgi:glutamate formiminotransferase/formiminotetrahydrofolate cyclodeaminase
MKLVECVPNVSEGRDRRILDTLGSAIAGVSGVQLLDVDPGVATHRTVYTFVGSPEAVEEAAFQLIAKAAELIDMRSHRGEHPRMGATDVVPFIPLGDMTMSECAAMARRLGRRVGEDLKIPVYLYEEAAASPARRSLAEVRKGEYEGLSRKLQDPVWKPDFGEARFNPRAGATVIGAREFLIAYNVSLNTRDRRLATLIAQNIRETGRPRRGPDGRTLKDADGATLVEPGPSCLPNVRATGWYIEEYGRAQVSINLTDYKVTPPHAAFEAVEKEAAALGLRVTGSEVVGLIPLEAMRMAGRHTLSRQGKSPSVPDAELVRMAVLSLGLSDVAPFDPDLKIVERRVTRPGRLMSLPARGFVDVVGSPVPAPGGGSVAALAGSLAAALGAMVAALTYERKGMEDRRSLMADRGRDAQEAAARLAAAVDADTDAFDGLMAAGRLPRRTDEERAARVAAMKEATLRAIDVPLGVMRDALRAQEIAGAMVEQGMASALSDAGVAALLAAAAVEGAGYNVRINLAGVSSPEEASARRDEAEALLRRSRDLSDRIRAAVDVGLSAPPS